MSEPVLQGYKTIDGAQPDTMAFQESDKEDEKNKLPPVEYNGISAGANGGPDSFNNTVYQEKPHPENGPTTTAVPLEEIDLNAGKKEKDSNSDAPEEKKNDKLVGVFELFRFADKIDVLLMILGTVCALCHGAAMPAMLVLFGEMTDSFVDSSLMNDTNMGLLDEMQDFAIYYTILGAGVLVVAYAQVTTWLLTSYRQTHKIRNYLLQRIMTMEIGWFDTNEVGELNTRLTDDVNKIREGIGDKIGNFFQWFSTFVTGIIIGFVYGWKLSLVIMSVSPLLALSGGIMAYMLTTATKNELDAYAKAGAVAEEVLSSVRTVFAFSGQKKECQRYSTNLEDARKQGLRKGVVTGGGMGVIFFIIFAVYALAFWYGSKLTRDEPDNYSVGTMMIVFFCVVFGAFGLGNAMPNIQNVAVARGAAYTVWEILDRKSEIDSSSDEGDRPSSLEGNITFEDVYFKYPSRPDVPVLNGLNLKASVGQTVALVGASGCGKSTTVQLILRFYDPETGRVLIDGRDVKSLNIKWLRQKIGLVSQEPVLFGTTIAENIRYGREGVSQEEIEAATKEANAYNFIMDLPHKFETLVGERGAQLSGGQKQRIAIARALVRDPKILLLDEATSALDTESESTVQAALDVARKGRTTLVIAHRLSTIKNADLIYGIHHGRVSESGSHDQLMDIKGIYHKLVMNQQVGLDDEDDDNIVTNDFKRLDSSRASKQLTRATSVISRTTSVDKSGKKEELPDVPYTRILKMNAPEWLLIVLGCVASAVNGAVQPAFAVIFSEIISVFVKPVEEQADDVFFYSMMFIVIGVVAGLAFLFQGLFLAASGEAMTKRLRQQMFEALMNQEVAYFDDHDNNTGALTTRLSTEASAVQGATGTRFGMAFQSLASVGTGLIIGFVYSWKLTLVIIAFVPFVLLAGALQMKLMMGYSGGGQEALEKAGKVAIEAIENMRTVASLTKEPSFTEKYGVLTGKPHKSSLKTAHLNGITFSFSQSIMYFAYAASFYFGAWLIENDGLFFGDMFKVFSAIIFGAMAMGQAASMAPDYGKAKAAANRAFALLDRVSAIDSSSPDGAKPGTFNGQIECKDVQFRYPTRPTVPVLRGLDLEVKKGQMVALVGSSGCGKSTTVQLVERFYDPDSGRLMLDEKTLTDLNLDWLRGQMAIVQQEPILFGCSIRDNIAYGDNSREVAMNEIIQAARDANIHSFIESLPEGYDTNVGEKGTQLSGGQKQRVAIARSLVRNPSILLLDEATSALDTESEKVVQEALDRAQQGRTSIVIAHRLSTIQNADCILVFHKGKVEEMGTHSELLSKRGIYYRLSMMQGKREE